MLTAALDPPALWRLRDVSRAHTEWQGKAESKLLDPLKDERGTGIRCLTAGIIGGPPGPKDATPTFGVRVVEGWACDVEVSDLVSACAVGAGVGVGVEVGTEVGAGAGVGAVALAGGVGVSLMKFNKNIWTYWVE